MIAAFPVTFLVLPAVISQPWLRVLVQTAVWLS